MTRRAWMAAALASSLLIAHGAATAQGAPAAPGAGLTTVRIAQQPQRWALEFFIASERGWWKEMGLNPVFSTFASGAVEIAAGASGSWDMGGGGNIPSVLGASRYGLQTIGIADGEAAIITVMATKDKADEYLKNPALLKGKIIPATLNTTGHWGGAECLQKKFGLQAGEFRLLNLSPPDINAAMMSGKNDVVAVWAPNTYILANAIGAKPICTGADVGLPIHSYLFTMPEFAQKNPEVVARVLAVYLRAVAWQRANPAETQQYLKVFFNSVGVKFPDDYLAQELRDRPAFSLDEQLKIFEAGAGDAGGIRNWWQRVGQFMVDNRIVPRIPDAQSTVSDKYLKMVRDDPRLRAFATNAQ